MAKKERPLSEHLRFGVANSKNVDIKLSDEGILTLSIDLNQPCWKSISGKSFLVGSTRGTVNRLYKDRVYSFILNCMTLTPTSVVEIERKERKRSKKEDEVKNA